MSDGVSDGDLRDRMRRADPAASLRPLPEDEARRLVAGAALDLPVVRKSYTRRVPVLIGAAAVVALAAGVVVLANTGAGHSPDWRVALPTSESNQSGLATGSGAPDGSGDGQPTTSGRPRPSAGTTSVPVPPVSPSASVGRKTTVAVLTDSPQDPDVRCPKPQAGFLAENAGMAFEATALKIEGNVVTLQVHHAWIGEADVIEVRNTTASPVLAGFAPEVGRKYLVAAADAEVMGCGYSGLDEPGLRAVYDEAFPKR
ncbi:hypothetical protein UK23_25870 [Lentzea aerocolonigenes]|uniref:Uncharacterized protein n=1 Tax=Lentzea aerocolonigenes TaxID=68170 RepID=A0A0F0GSL0_LENAE|nr:hypothetical protein [Lentzea aerocolonigenes]KJK45571.1 hypothetical protein UK23_25870 [Lentzea aerocolonigenes]